MLIGKPKPKPQSQFPNAVVLPLPKFKPKQRIAWDSKATEILLGGDTRAGKSFFIKKAYIRFAAEIEGLVLDIFRLHYDDVVKNYMKGEWSFPVFMARWIDKGLCHFTENSWRLWNGSYCQLYHCGDDIVMQKHQGNPSHVRTIEEACQIPERRLRLLTGWMDMSDEMKARIPKKWEGCFPRIYYPTNPTGPSAGFFARHFVDARPEYAIEQVGAFLRQHIPFELADNDSVNHDIVRARIKNAFPDPAMQKALLERDWHARTGLFFTEWNEDRHVIPDIVLPPHWYRYRTFDWGTSDPAYCAYWAISDGYPFMEPTTGIKLTFPRGALILYNEWYICDDGHADPDLNRYDKGRNMSNEDMAHGILERSEINAIKVITLSDSKPFQGNGGRIIDDMQEGPAKTFKECGVPLTKAPVGPGTRVPGWASMRDRLIGKVFDTTHVDDFGKPIKIPMLFVFASCKYARDYIPQLPRHPNEAKYEDAAESGEPTHVCFTGDTLVKTPSGDRRIDSLVAGDSVISGDGTVNQISFAGITGYNREIIKIIMTDGSTLRCTPDHKILTVNGWTRAIDILRYECIKGECASKSFQKRFKSLTAKNTNSMEKLDTLLMTKKGFIGLCGNITTAQFLISFTSTIKTITDSIINLRILSLFTVPNILVSTCNSRSGSRLVEKISNLPRFMLKNGMGAKRVENGIEKPLKRTEQRYFNDIKRIVRSAARNLKQISMVNSVAEPVRLEPCGNADVYCLTEPITSSFQLANGLVVKNCDAIRYACVAHNMAVIKNAIPSIEESTNRAIAQMSKGNTVKNLTGLRQL